VIRRALAAFLLLALAGCHAADKDAAGAPAPGATSAAQNVSQALGITPKPTKTVAVSAMAPFSVHPNRDLHDMVAGCPGLSATSRPRGSNCHGIFPEQCGADRAAAFQGQKVDSTLKEQIAAIEPPEGVRYIGIGEAYTQDLRKGRLNILTGPDKLIVEVDCF